MAQPTEIGTEFLINTTSDNILDISLYGQNGTQVHAAVEGANSQPSLAATDLFVI